MAKNFVLDMTEQAWQRALLSCGRASAQTAALCHWIVAVTKILDKISLLGGLRKRTKKALKDHIKSIWHCMMISCLQKSSENLEFGSGLQD